MTITKEMILRVVDDYTDEDHHLRARAKYVQLEGMLDAVFTEIADLERIAKMPPQPVPADTLIPLTDADVRYDPSTDELIIFGVRYAAPLLKTFAYGAIGTTIRIVSHHAGCVTVKLVADPRVDARWYSVDKRGEATLCVDKDDAESNAAFSSKNWPNNAPYRAVQLTELQP